LSFGGSGDVNALGGDETFPSCPDVACDGDAGLDTACEACLDCWCFSASFFSRVPRSVAPLSSSPSNPVQHVSPVSLRIHRVQEVWLRLAGYAEPNSYLITSRDSPCGLTGSRGPQYTSPCAALVNWLLANSGFMNLPLWRVSLLFDLGEHTIRLVIDAMRAGRQLAVALDFLLSAHVASLCTKPLVRQTDAHMLLVGTSSDLSVPCPLTLAIRLRLASLVSSIMPWSANICALSNSGGIWLIGSPCSGYPPNICGGWFMRAGAAIGIWKPACM
jgi:hypothetical protein